MAVRALLVSAPMKAWAFGLFAVLLVGCQNRGAAPSGKTAFQVQLASAPASLDPVQLQAGAAFRVLGAVMDGLIGLDLQGKIEPRLAKTYEVSADGKRYTFTLRPEALWSDGRPVLPKEFVQGFQRVLDPATQSPWAQLLFPIRGARAFHEKKGGFEQVGVRGEGENQLVIELEKPVPAFLSVLTLPIAYPARPEWETTPSWNDKTPVTGPYQVAFQKAGESILLAPNEHYWGRRVLGKMIARPVMLRITPDPAEAQTLLSSGRLDVLVQESKVLETKKTGSDIDPLAPFRMKSALTLSARVAKAPVDSLGLIRFEDVEIK